MAEGKHETVMPQLSLPISSDPSGGKPTKQINLTKAGALWPLYKTFLFRITMSLFGPMRDNEGNMVISPERRPESMDANDHRLLAELDEKFPSPAAKVPQYVGLDDMRRAGLSNASIHTAETIMELQTYRGGTPCFPGDVVSHRGTLYNVKKKIVWKRSFKEGETWLDRGLFMGVLAWKQGEPEDTEIQLAFAEITFVRRAAAAQ